jgi:hypothetical protein
MPETSDDASLVLPVPGAQVPGVVQVRLVGPPAVIEAASVHLAELHGEAWQPGGRRPSRYEGGELLLRGTLIVPVPRG